jgi:hypothetical protein
LKDGNRVIVVGSSAPKGDSFPADDERLAYKQCVVVMQAGLSLLEENRGIINDTNLQRGK